MYLILKNKDIKLIYYYLFAILEDKRLPEEVREEYIDKLRKDLINNGKKNS